MTIINGRKIAKRILAEQKLLLIKHKLRPKLVTILIGNNEASRIYINEKRKKARQIGIDFQNFHLPADMWQQEILGLIEKLNNDKAVSGIILQLPIPKNFDADTIVKTIDPKKDADGFHPKNIKKFLALDNFDNILRKNLILPATPAAIMEILNNVKIPPRAKIVVIGKCSIFITPLIHFFAKNSNYQLPVISYQIISPDDPNLAKKSMQADILITVCGKPHFIKAHMVKAGAIVIDVGISRAGGKVIGDVDFSKVVPKTSFITPVPGGVGPVTVAVLLRNVVFAVKN